MTKDQKDVLLEVVAGGFFQKFLECFGIHTEHSEGLKETPARVVRAYREMLSGLGQDPKELFKVFEEGVEKYDGMVLCRNVEFYSLCEHHFLPFYGVAHVGYIPNGRVIGLSKLARLVDLFAKQPQIQERMTRQITATLDQFLMPIGSACVVVAKHLCLACRGAKKVDAEMVTSSMTGSFMEEASARAEFMSLVFGR